MNAAPEEEEILGANVFLGELLAFPFAGKQRFEFSGDQGQLSHVELAALQGNLSAQLSQIQSQKEEGRQLRGKSFGRGHADLGSRMGIERTGSFAGNHGSHNVTN